MFHKKRCIRTNSPIFHVGGISLGRVVILGSTGNRGKIFSSRFFFPLCSSLGTCPSHPIAACVWMEMGIFPSTPVCVLLDTAACVCWERISALTLQKIPLLHPCGTDPPPLTSFPAEFALYSGPIAPRTGNLHRLCPSGPRPTTVRRGNDVGLRSGVRFCAS